MTQRSIARWILGVGLGLGLAALASSGPWAGRAARQEAAGAAPLISVKRAAEVPPPSLDKTPDKTPDKTTAEASQPGETREVRQDAPRSPGPVGARERPQAARVSRVQIVYGDGGEAFIDVSMSDPAPYHAMHLKNPPRFAVDIEPARVENLRSVYPAESPLLKDARVGQFDRSTVRVVADLTGHPVPDVYPEPGGLRIALWPATASQTSPEHEVRSSGKPAVSVQNIPPQGKVPAHPNSEPRAPGTTATTLPEKAKVPERQTQKQLPDGPAPATVDVPPTHRPTLPSASLNLVDSSRRAELTAPIALPRNADAPWLPRKIVMAGPRDLAKPSGESAPASEAARVLAEGGASSVGDAGGPGAAPTSPVPAARPAPGKPKYTGERISVNLKDVDVTDFFRLVHEVSGLNVIVDSNVSGKVTLVLDSVPWDQALDIVLKNNGLGRVLEGNVLRIGRIQTLEQEEDAAVKLQQAKLEAGPLVTVIWPLKYARALDTAAAQSTAPGLPAATATPGLVSILKNLTGVLSSRGGVVADPRSNSLIITDVPSQIPIIESVVEKLDTKPKQISIEARVVLANSDFVRDLASALNGGTVNRSGSTVTGGATGTGASAQGNIPTPAGASGTPPPRISLGQTVAAGFGAFALSNESARYFINAAIAAAETRDQARTVSLPTIITQNNVAGKVAQGIEVPYQTTINNTISTQFKDATLELDVTPQVTQDGNVFLLLYVQDDTVGAVVPGIGTSINHQSATTQVLVPDGGTVVFGGIKVSRRAKTSTQVPGLGSVPLLGNLFKSSEIDRNDQELLFFVSPKVLPG